MSFDIEAVEIEDVGNDLERTPQRNATTPVGEDDTTVVNNNATTSTGFSNDDEDDDVVVDGNSVAKQKKEKIYMLKNQTGGTKKTP